MSKKICCSCSATFSSNTSELCLKCMMNGVIAKQEAEEYQAETDRLASKSKREAYAKLRRENPDFDMQWAAAVANNKSSPKLPLIDLKFGLKPIIKSDVIKPTKNAQKPFPTDPKFEFNTVKTADILKATKGPRIVRPPPQKKLTGTFCILCGATVIDIRQHKHDVHHERLYVSSAPTRSAKENVWVSIYEGGAPGLGKRHS